LGPPAHWLCVFCNMDTLTPFKSGSVRVAGGGLGVSSRPLPSSNMSTAKSEVKGTSVMSRTGPIHNRLKEREEKLIESNIVKINKENVHETFVKVSKANNMGKMLNPKVNFKASSNEAEEIRIKMYENQGLVKTLDIREFEAEFHNQVQIYQKTLSSEPTRADLGRFEVQGRQ